MLKKILAFALVLSGAFLFAPAARSQSFTTVTATVHDPNGIPYAGGTVTATLTPSVPGGYRLNGQPYSGQISGGSLDATGSFTLNFGSNAVILPAGSQWIVRVASNPGGIAPPLGTGAQSFTITITISGASQNISTALNAAAPALTNFAGTGGTVTSVSCGNLVNVFNCSVATPTTTPALSFVPITTGPVLDCSQQPGFPDAGLQINNCLAALDGGTGIADATKFGPMATITTPIDNSFSATIATCGTAFTEVGGITLSGFGASWWACPQAITSFDKAANIDQFTVTGQNNVISNVLLFGEADTPFTGDGIVLNGNTNALVDGVTINSEAGSEVHAISAGSESKIQNSFLEDTRLHAIFIDGDTLLTAQNTEITDGGGGTGDTIITKAAPNVGFHGSELSVTTRSAHISFNNQQIGGVTSTIYSSTFLNIGGMPAMQLSSTDIVMGNRGIFGGGPGQPAIKGPLGDPGGAATISFNQNVENLAGGDTMDVGGQSHIEGNYLFVTLTGMMNKCGINLLGESFGAIVQKNNITFSGGESGPNSGICMTPLAAQPATQNRIRDNEVALSSTVDRLFQFNNTANVSGSNDSQITDNFSVATGGIIISRIDPAGNRNYYSNNGGSFSSLFDAGGSAGDVISGTAQPILFANLPAIAGPGSYFSSCTDCQMNSIVGATSNGGPIWRQSTIVTGGSVVNWSGNTSIIGQDTHTAEITGNYGAVQLIPSTAATGSYLVTIYTEVSTSVATSTITPSIAYHDDTGAQTQSGALFSGATAGTIQTLTFPVRFVTGTGLTYSTTTANNPKYKIMARVEAQ